MAQLKRLESKKEIEYLKCKWPSYFWFWPTFLGKVSVRVIQINVNVCCIWHNESIDFFLIFLVNHLCNHVLFPVLYYVIWSHDTSCKKASRSNLCFITSFNSFQIFSRLLTSILFIVQFTFVSLILIYTTARYIYLFTTFIRKMFLWC